MKNETKRRNYLRLSLSVLGIFLTVFLAVFLAQVFLKMRDSVLAANLNNFQAGYIISDWQMTDYTSMSETDIQNFLWEKGKCYNTDFSGVGTRVDYFSDHTPPTTWHVKDGHTVCLAEENINGETAAHIIWQAAQDYKINPKVLIVLIQKETGLITDPIPNSWDYQRTAGYGCPDTAACSEKYYGFKNQIRNAASLFRIVMDGNSSYYPIGNNVIQYSPNAACGSSVVYIQNLATSALYRYTPYQPNAAALAAGYGTASCGAYGNRNFYAYFEDWFGDINEEGVLDFPESSSIVEGDYIIESALKTNTVVDVTAGSSANGANIQLYTSNGSGAQKWRVLKESDGSYSIRNIPNNKALDVQGAKTKNGTNVQLYSYNGSCAQKWHIVQNDDKTYSIYSVCSGRVLDVTAGSSKNGTNIQIYRPNGSAAQKWKLIPERTLEDGEYTISSNASDGKVIDITNGAEKATNGTNIQVYTKNDTDAQKWVVTYGSDGYYTIKNPATGKVLDVKGASVTDGANVHLYAANGSCAQKWQIAGDENGYTVISSCSGLLLESKNNNVQVGNSAASAAQKWKFDLNLPVKEGNYIIQSALDKDKVVDVTAGLLGNGVNIQLYSNNGSGAQRWRLLSNGDGTYTIKNAVSGKVVDVYAGQTHNAANVQTYEYNGSCAQKWQIMKNDDNTYTFLSTCSGRTLDVKYGNSSNGTNIQIYDSNGSPAQKWRLVSY